MNSTKFNKSVAKFKTATNVIKDAKHKSVMLDGVMPTLTKKAVKPKIQKRKYVRKNVAPMRSPNF